MNRAESYWIQATVNSAFFNESVSDKSEIQIKNISCDLHLECTLCATKEGFDFPFETFRVTLRECEEKFLNARPESLEFGFLREEGYFLLWARKELIRNVCSSLGLIKGGAVEVFITLPYAKSETTDFLKILDYQVRITA